MFVELLQPNLEENLANTHPKATKNFADKYVVEESLAAVEHFVEDVVELGLRAKSDLGDAVLVLPLNELGQQVPYFLECLAETVSLDVNVKHLLA